MQILFAITGVSLVALLWAVIAIRRHVAAATREREERRQAPLTTTMERELKSELRAQHQENGFFGSVSDPQPARHGSRVRPAVRDSAIRASVMAVPVFEASQEHPPVPVQSRTDVPAAQNSEPAATESRKPPVSIGGRDFEKMDLSQYQSNEMGDLSDPYQVPRAASSIRNRS